MKGIRPAFAKRVESAILPWQLDELFDESRSEEEGQLVLDKMQSLDDFLDSSARRFNERRAMRLAEDLLGSED